ncbi:MCE family protein [Pseudonocardia sp. GCM10023141]|uniref:MCE family protein n=1 Tax=Pseudonocardia sp. GCM10023141 TaxID=3252653 RepID=UPI0036134995
MSRIPLAPLIKFLALAVVIAMATTVLALTIANASSGDRVSYTARFTDATGLLAGDDVRIAGVVVGAVDSIKIADRRFADVTFSVDRNRPIPSSAIASILYKNLIGQRFLGLAQAPGPQGVMLAANALIPAEQTRAPLNLTTLFNGFKPLFEGLDPQQINQLSFEIVQVLQGQGGTVSELLASTSSLTNTLADRDQVIGQVIDNLNSVLTTVNSRDQQLSDLVSSLQELVSGLAQDRKPIGDAIVSIGHLTEVTSSLVDDARPALKDDIAALGSLADNFNQDEPKVEQTIKNLPIKLEAISHVGTYGSWFQFYLCGLSGTVGLKPYIPAFEIPAYSSPSARCGPDPAGAGANAPNPLGGLPALPAPLPALPSSVPSLPALPALPLGGG